MSSRGRGYGGGRGGYGGSRGGGYRGGYRGGSSRGSYERGGGRGGYSSYNSHERYNTNSNDRYGSGRSDRMEESYKKPYRTESSSYSSREYVGRSGSPERKRMRMEGSAGDRRSHDGGGHYGGSSYSGRQESYVSERRPYGGGEERRRSPSREGYRKSSGGGGMGPPRSPPPLRSLAPRARSSRPPRRSFRGRTLRSRGSYRGTLRPRGSYPRRPYTDRSLDYARSYRVAKIRSSIKPKQEDSASSTEGEDWDADEKATADDSKESKGKSPKVSVSVADEVGEEEAGEVEVGDQGAGEEGSATDKEGEGAGSEEGGAPVRRSRFTGRPFIQLSCVHCKEKSITFAAYARHLLGSKHRAAMSGVARRHKAQLLRMRLAQRGAQRELESSLGPELAPRSTFCPVCKLNHRTTRHEHNLTDTHRAMKRFLMPFCRVCRMTFRSPMIYEHHICSLDHIKRKARQARPPSPKADDASGDEGMDVDLDNFMTLDSVGDVDEVEDDDSGGEKKEEDGADVLSPKKPKVEINVGSEHIKKIEVFWCELCRVNLPTTNSATEHADALRRHCRLRAHLSRYVKHRDTRTLRKQAERIHRQLHQQKEGEKESVTVKQEKEKEEVNKPVENGGGDASAAGAGEEKLWADVDKDIGELLREVDPQGNEASDDEEDLGRYDKFSKSDKVIEGAEAGGEGAAADPAPDANAAEVKAAA